MQIRYISTTSSRPPSLLRKAGMAVGALVAVSLTLMFAAVLVPIVLIGGAYLWWKTREVRKQLRAQRQNFPPPGATMQHDPFGGEVFEGEIIEGEVVRVSEPTAPIESAAHLRRPF